MFCELQRTRRKQRTREGRRLPYLRAIRINACREIEVSGHQFLTQTLIFIRPRTRRVEIAHFATDLFSVFEDDELTRFRIHARREAWIVCREAAKLLTEVQSPGTRIDDDDGMNFWHDF